MTWRRGLLYAVIFIGISLAGIVGYVGYRIVNFQFASGVSGPFLAARQASAENDMSNASHYFAMALALSPDDARIRNEAFSAYLENGDIERAVALASMLQSDYLMRQQSNLVLLIDALKRDRLDKARDLLSGFSAGPQSNLLVPVINAWIDYARDGVVGEERLLGLLDPGPLMPVTTQQAAILYELMGNVEAADAAYARGIQAGGMQLVGFAVGFGQYLERQNNNERADQLYEIASQYFGDAPDFVVSYQRYQAQEAPPQLSRDLRPHVASALLSLVENMRMDGNAAFMRPYIQLALHLAPSARGLFLLGDLTADEEAWWEAARYYEQVTGHNTYVREAQIRRAQMYERAGALDEAEALFVRLVDQYSDNKAAKVAIADFYRRAERFEEAETYYIHILDMVASDDQAYWGVHFSLGICRERLGRWAEAEKSLLIAKTLSRDEPLVLNYLGYSWIDKGIRLEEARDLVEIAVKKDPTNGFYLDSLGWAYYKLGEYEPALTLIERATLLEPTDATITDHLGDILWRLNRKTEARYQWQKSLGFNPSEDDQQAIEHKLINGLPPIGEGGRSI